MEGDGTGDLRSLWELKYKTHGVGLVAPLPCSSVPSAFLDEVERIVSHCRNRALRWALLTVLQMCHLASSDHWRDLSCVGRILRNEVRQTESTVEDPRKVGINPADEASVRRSRIRRLILSLNNLQAHLPNWMADPRPR